MCQLPTIVTGRVQSEILKVVGLCLTVKQCHIKLIRSLSPYIFKLAMLSVSLLFYELLFIHNALNLPMTAPTADGQLTYM